MTATLFRGATTLRNAIGQFLSIRMPVLVAEARESWGIEADYLLPVPAKYDSYDPLTADTFPTVGSFASRSTRWSRVNVGGDGSQQYLPLYTVRAFIWCRTPQDASGVWVQPEYDEALRCRDDLMSVLRTAFLDRPSMGFGSAFMIQEGSVTEDYLDAIKGSSGSHWLAGGVISMDVQVNEQILIADDGPLSGIFKGLNIEGYGPAELFPPEKG